MYAHTLSTCAPPPRATIWRELAENGFVFIRDLPEGFDHLELVASLGKLRPQYGGARTMVIAPKDGGDDHYHSLSTQELYPHTEAYEEPGVPPRYLGLWCVKRADCGGGVTHLADFWRFASSLDRNLRERLRREKLRFCSTPGLMADSMGLEPVCHPLLEEAPDGHLIVRFSTVCMVGDAALLELVLRYRFFEWRERATFRWKERALLIWDNHRMTHSRSSFQDRSRSLVRVWFDPLE